MTLPPSTSPTATGIPTRLLGTWDSWKLIRRILVYRPRLYAANVLLWGLMHGLPVAAGLFTRMYFDALAGPTEVGWNAWTAIALLVSFHVSRLVVFVSGFWVWSTLAFTSEALLRRNLLIGLCAPRGRRRCATRPERPSSRFRDDVQEVMRYLENWVDGGGCCFLVFALGIMAGVDAA